MQRTLGRRCDSGHGFSGAGSVGCGFGLRFSYLGHFWRCSFGRLNTGLRRSRRNNRRFGFGDGRYLQGIGRTGRRRHRPLPDPTTQNPGLPILGIAVSVSLHQHCARRVQHPRLTPTISQTGPGHCRGESCICPGRHHRPRRKGVPMLSRHSRLQNITTQIILLIIRVKYFDELILLVHLRRHRVRKQLRNLHRRSRIIRPHHSTLRRRSHRRSS